MGTFHEWRDSRYAWNGVYECECNVKSHGSISNILVFAALYCSGKYSFGH